MPKDGWQLSMACARIGAGGPGRASQYRTSHRLIDVVVFRDIFGNKALNAVSAIWAPVHKKSGMREEPRDGARRSRP